jgi:lysophospholipase L1-like esterase
MGYDKRSIITLFDVFVVALLVVSMTGCSGSGPTASSSQSPPASAPTAKATVNSTRTGGNVTTVNSSSLHAHLIVCVGDSITEGFADPNNWPHWLKARLGVAWQVVNQGVGGDKTADMLARIDQALALNPHFVIILGGTNDLANGDVSLETMQANICEMCTKIEYHDAVPIVCTVPPNSFFLEQRDLLNAWIVEYANTKGYGLIDFYAVIDDPSNPGHSNPLLVMSDGLHPNDKGYSAMGNAIDLCIFTGDTNQYI